MALCGCTPGSLLFTAFIAVLLLPAQYYVPEFTQENEQVVEKPTSDDLLSIFKDLPTEDIYLAGVSLILAGVILLCDLIQRKLMERRICKLNQYVTMSLERLKEMNAEQEELEATLKMVHNATSEYNLLLYLLLREQKILTHKGPPSTCFFDESLAGNIDDLMLS